MAEKNWNLATLNFTLKEFSEHLYIKFLSTKKPDGNYRIDDVTLVTSAGGQQVDLDNGSVTPPVGDVELPTSLATVSTMLLVVLFTILPIGRLLRVMLGIRPILNWDGSAVYLETRSIFSVLLTAQRRRPLRLML